LIFVLHIYTHTHTHTNIYIYIYIYQLNKPFFGEIFPKIKSTEKFTLLMSSITCLHNTESFILNYVCSDPTGTKPRVVMGEYTSGGFPLPSAVYDSIHPDRTARAL
jgi:hypothetical protein